MSFLIYFKNNFKKIKYFDYYYMVWKILQEECNEWGARSKGNDERVMKEVNHKVEYLVMLAVILLIIAGIISDYKKK